MAVSRASRLGEGSWTSQRAQPEALLPKSVLVPGANGQTPLGWEALPGLRECRRTFFFRKELTKWQDLELFTKAYQICQVFLIYFGKWRMEGWL